MIRSESSAFDLWYAVKPSSIYLPYFPPLFPHWIVVCIYMPIIKIGHKTKQRMAAYQHTIVPPIKPKMTIAKTSKIVTMVSDVRPFSSAIFEAFYTNFRLACKKG